jgi:hypothetical protein
MKSNSNPVVDTLSRELHRVVGERFRRSGLGVVWRDEHTWRELAQELVKALGGSIVFVDKEMYNELVREARQMKRVRQRVADYYEMMPKQRQNSSKSPYAKWAEENMKTEK